MHVPDMHVRVDGQPRLFLDRPMERGYGGTTGAAQARGRIPVWKGRAFETPVVAQHAVHRPATKNVFAEEPHRDD